MADRSRRLPVAALLASCLVAAACDGGGGGQTTDPSRALTKAEVIDRVDELCSEGRTRLEDLDPPKSLRQTDEFLSRLLPVVEKQLDRIRLVGPIPAQDRATYIRWLRARQGIVELTRRMIDAAEEGDATAFRQLASEQDLLDEVADKAAREYGLKVCGEASLRPVPEPIG